MSRFLQRCLLAPSSTTDSSISRRIKKSFCPRRWQSYLSCMSVSYTYPGWRKSKSISIARLSWHREPFSLECVSLRTNTTSTIKREFSKREWISQNTSLLMADQSQCPIMGWYSYSNCRNLLLQIFLLSTLRVLKWCSWNKPVSWSQLKISLSSTRIWNSMIMRRREFKVLQITMCSNYKIILPKTSSSIKSQTT